MFQVEIYAHISYATNSKNSQSVAQSVRLGSGESAYRTGLEPRKRERKLEHGLRIRYQTPCRDDERNARWNPPIDFSIRSSGIVSDRRM